MIRRDVCSLWPSTCVTVSKHGPLQVELEYTKLTTFLFSHCDSSLPLLHNFFINSLEFGVEKAVMLDGATTAEEVEKRIESLLN